MSEHAPQLAALLLGAIAAPIDLRTGRIPDRLTLPVLFAAPLIAGLADGVLGLASSLLGLALAAAVPLAAHARGAMGGGDVKLFAALGALLGASDALAIELAALSLVCALGLARWIDRGELRLVLAAARRGTVHAALTEPVRLAPYVLASALVVLGWPLVA